MTATMLKALTQLKMAGLQDYGRWPADSASLAAMATFWADSLTQEGVLEETVMVAARNIGIRERDFPTLSEFGEECKKARRQMYDLIGIEVTGPDGDICLEIVEVPVKIPAIDRTAFAVARCRERGREVVDQPALPLPSELSLQRQELREIVRAKKSDRGGAMQGVDEIMDKLGGQKTHPGGEK